MIVLTFFFLFHKIHALIIYLLVREIELKALNKNSIQFILI